jgi:hypothetical protein
VCPLLRTSVPTTGQSLRVTKIREREGGAVGTGTTFTGCLNTHHFLDLFHVLVRPWREEKYCSGKMRAIANRVTSQMNLVRSWLDVNLQTMDRSKMNHSNGFHYFFAVDHHKFIIIISVWNDRYNNISPNKVSISIVLFSFSYDADHDMEDDDDDDDGDDIVGGGGSYFR